MIEEEFLSIESLKKIQKTLIMTLDNDSDLSVIKLED